MAAAFTPINQGEIDDTTKYLITGYIRKIEKTSKHMVPQEIMYLIISFYYLSFDYFKIFNKHIFQTASNGTRVKSINHSVYFSVYGDISLSNLKDKEIIWTFKLLHKRIEDFIFIGISASYNPNQRFFHNVRSNNYCIGLDGTKWSKCNFGMYHGHRFQNKAIILC